MNLIVESSLTCDEGLYFRFVSMVAKKDLNYDILIEARKEDTDHYFRIDTELNYPMTIKVSQIRCENTLNVLGQLKSLRELKF